jgi:hypothetical protein
MAAQADVYVPNSSEEPAGAGEILTPAEASCKKMIEETKKLRIFSATKNSLLAIHRNCLQSVVVFLNKS